MNDKSNNDFHRIQNRADIVEIIRSYIKLESHGKNFFGVCPFHDDHSPSMSVSPSKQIYKCFVCGASGNVFNFVENYLGVSFIEAVKIVADKVGEAFTIRESREDQRNSKYYDIMNLATLFYQNNLRTNAGKMAREYLHSRGLNDEIIKDFSIGLALPENDMLFKLLTNKKIDKKDMDALGLVADGENGTYDLFRNRIIFPLKSSTGKVNGFSGRIYNTDSQSKYVNTKETIIFKKRENLYNYHLAAPAARQEKFIVVCEGFMDAIRIYSVGIKNVIATMGTALAKEQIALLKKLNVRIIIVMDNDAAGELATVSLGQSLMKENMDIGIVRLTGKKDPDEYILTYGVEAFRDNLRNPLSYPEFMEIYLRKNRNLKNPTELTAYINDVVNMIADSNDDILIEVTINKLANEFHLDKDLLKSRLKNKELLEEVTVHEESVEKTVKEAKTTGKFNKAFKTMLYYMMNDTDAMRMFMHYHLDLPKCKYRLVSNNLLYYFELNREIDFADYLTFSEDYSEVSEVVKEVIRDVHADEFTLDDVEAVILVIKDILDKEKIKDLKREMKLELDVNRKKRLFEEIIEIKKGCVKDGRD
ncbi:MAG: DNA primase [Bacilli bacterium]|nr:DNA primase [Bacilli bacterium]